MIDPNPASAPKSPAAPATLPAMETRAAQLILGLFLAAITLPYAFAALIMPPGLVWGGLLGSADDQNVHLMWARQVRDGAFFMRDLFTTETLASGKKPLFFNALPWGMGVLSRGSGLDVVVWYHVIRVAAAALGLWQFHLLARAITRDEARYSRARILALALVAFTLGGGVLGTFLPVLASRFQFIDRPIGAIAMMPEAFYALSALLYPINTASMALLALIFRLVIQKRGGAAIFGAALLLSNIHTYDALPLLVALAVWAIWSARQGDRASSKVCAMAIFGALLPLIYQFVVFRGSEEFRIKALTPTPAPAPIHLAMSFLPLLIWLFWTRREWRDLPATRLLWVWVLAVVALIYAPVSFARKMIEGAQLPLCLLAGLGLSAFVSRFASRGARLALAGAAVGLPLLSAAQVWGWVGQNAVENNASRLRFRMPPLAISSGEAKALAAIDADKTVGAVLCLPFVGSYVPRATGKFTYLGHWAETLHFERKWGEVTGFYRGAMTPAQSKDFLAQNHIRWVVFGPAEREIANRELPAGELGLQPISQGGDTQTGLTTLYRVS